MQLEHTFWIKMRIYKSCHDCVSLLHTHTHTHAQVLITFGTDVIDIRTHSSYDYNEFTCDVPIIDPNNNDYCNFWFTLDPLTFIMEPNEITFISITTIVDIYIKDVNTDVLLLMLLHVVAAAVHLGS